MQKRACFVGSVAASVALLAAGTPAFADSADNDGVNVGNDNNVTLAPVQVCGLDIVGAGSVVSVLSPQTVNCTNAPIVDHPQTSDEPDYDPNRPPGHHEDPCADHCKPEHPKPHHPKPEQPCHEVCKPEHPKPHFPKPEEPCHEVCKPEHPKPHFPKPEHGKPELPGKPAPQAPAPQAPAPQAVSPAAPEEAALPAAPAPVSMPGHVAVTG